MNNMKHIFLLAAVAFCMTSQAQRSYEEQVQKTVAQFVKALEDSDLKSLSSLTVSKLTYGHSSGKIENKEQFLQTFKTGASDFAKINISGQTIDIAGTTAIVRHLFDAEPKSGPATVKQAGTKRKKYTE